MTEQLQGSVTTRANVYFDGKCVSHGVTLADGTKKSVGVILPSTLKFNTGAPEVMELIETHGLMGRGVGYVDMHLVASAILTGIPLWTFDRKLAEAASILGKEYLLFNH